MPLGALSQAWVSAEASLPLGWRIAGLWCFDAVWIAVSGSGEYADQALRRLAD